MAYLQISSQVTVQRRSGTTETPDRAAYLRARRISLGNPVLLGFRRMIEQAVAGAKKTRHGHPTALALQDRWWLQQFRPARPGRGSTRLERDLFAGSFEGCCQMLGWDVETYRSKYIAEIDDVWARAAISHVADESYRRTAEVLACAGVPTAVARQFVLGLASPEEYDEVAGVDRPDPPQRKRRRPARPRGKAARLVAAA